MCVYVCTFVLLCVDLYNEFSNRFFKGMVCNCIAANPKLGMHVAVNGLNKLEYYVWHKVHHQLAISVAHAKAAVTAGGQVMREEA